MTPTGKRSAYALAFAALCAGAILAAIAIPSADASRAKVIGHTKHTPRPACPNLKDTAKCQVVGRVTGFMTVADGRKRPFRAPRDGRIVAWAVDLGKATDNHGANELTYFGTLFQSKDFGKQPTGRLAVIKHKNGVSYKLLRQSPVVGLRGALGSKQIYTLDKPLLVRKGDIVAFTSPTFTPNFAYQGLSSKNNKWRGSRKKDNCVPRGGNSPTDRQKRRFARHSHAHQKVGSIHSYECLYTGGRILYWAYFVPNK